MPKAPAKPARVRKAPAKAKPKAKAAPRRGKAASPGARAKSAAPAREPRGFGGWLAVLAGLQIVVLIRLADTIRRLLGMIGSEVWQAHRLAAVLDIALYGGALMLHLYVLLLMARRRAAFVPLFVVAVVVYFVIGRIDQAIAILAFGMDPARLASGAVLLPMLAELLIGAGWILYVLRSRRVRNTFNDRTN